MSKIEGLPYGACNKAVGLLKAEGYNYSLSMVIKVAKGKRENIIIENVLLRIKREHAARQRKVERAKAKINSEMEKYRIGEIDTRQN
ncbi:MAG: hypothetical protein IKJ78_04145 [Bacteroidales bacterium]|nr:hypothetical protein [Bacteroidales bacterium]